MSDKDIIKVEVSFPPWSDADKSWYLLVDKHVGGWSRGEWFPKSICKLDQKKDGVSAVLSLPIWLAKNKNLKPPFNSDRLKYKVMKTKEV